MRKSVSSFKEKNHDTALVFLLSNCPQVLRYCITDLLNTIFDNFGICLLGYRFEFSCLYICHKVIISQVLCGYEIQMNMYIYDLSESPPLKSTHSKGCVTLWSMYCSNFYYV